MTTDRRPRVEVHRVKIRLVPPYRPRPRCPRCRCRVKKFHTYCQSCHDKRRRAEWHNLYAELALAGVPEDRIRKLLGLGRQALRRAAARLGLNAVMGVWVVPAPAINLRTAASLGHLVRREVRALRGKGE